MTFGLHILAMKKIVFGVNELHSTIGIPLRYV